jgi:hypothetical protein
MLLPNQGYENDATRGGKANGGGGMGSPRSDATRFIMRGSTAKGNSFSTFPRFAFVFSSFRFFDFALEIARNVFTIT